MTHAPDRYVPPRLMWLLPTLVILLVGLTLQHALQQLEDIYRSDSLNHAIDLRDEFKQTDIFLEAIQSQAEERLRSDPKSALAKQLYSHIKVRSDQGLAIDQKPHNLPKWLVGNLTGEGPLPAEGSAREASIYLALSLSPLLATASQRLGDRIAWVYFTGVDNFIYLYPWRPSSVFRFSREIYNKHYWRGPATASTPPNTTILSHPYEDVAGRGRMITLSKPLYKDGVRVGMISMDILLARLSHQLNKHPPRVGSYNLINQYRQVLASSPLHATIPLNVEPSEQYHWQQGGLQRTLAIPDTPLLLVHHITWLSLAQAIIQNSIPTLIAIFCMLLATRSYLKSRQLNQQLSYLSCHDALTGAFNRHYLRSLEQRQDHTARPGMLMFDADYFKQVNDNFGHLVGDTVLICLAQLCQAQLTRSDCLIRLGGEEFLLFIANGNAPRMATFAEHLRAIVADHDWTPLAPGLAVTISIGYHPYQDNVPIHEAIHRADMALYQAKTNGRNRAERWQDDDS